MNLLSDLPVPGVPARFSFSNAYAPTRNVGTELLLRWRTGPFVVLVAYGYVNATELPPDVLVRRTVPLNPRHSANFTATWEKEEIGRIGVECFFTRHQALIDNPYRSTSPSFVMFGLLVQRQFGSASVFLNGENLTGKRQTRFDPLVLPARAADGRRTIDECGARSTAVSSTWECGGGLERRRTRRMQTRSARDGVAGRVHGPRRPFIRHLQVRTVTKLSCAGAVPVSTDVTCHRAS